MVAVYAPSSFGERRSFFRLLVPFLDDPKRIILVGDLNAILDSKIVKAGRGDSGSDRCESSLSDLVAQHNLVDRLRLDRLGREMWRWLDSVSSVHIRTHLDRVLVTRADTEFVRCLTFHWLPPVAFSLCSCFRAPVP